MIEKYKISENQLKLVENDEDVLQFYKIDPEEKKILIEKYYIDEHSINSSLDPDEVPRLEAEGDNINLIWKIPTVFRLGDTSSFDVVSIGFFIRQGKLIIISGDFFSYLKENTIVKAKTIYDFLLILMDLTIKHFIEHLKTIKLISRELQKKINEAMENEYLLKMFDLSEILVYYMDAINGDKTILNKLSSALKCSGVSFNENYCQDIINETDQASKQAEIYSQIFAGLMDARGTIVNNNMNVLIKNLTIINIIFLPLNLLASIGGMSEFSAFTNKIPWPISYGLFTISMVIIGWITLLIINKTKILKGKSKGL